MYKLFIYPQLKHLGVLKTSLKCVHPYQIKIGICSKCTCKCLRGEENWRKSSQSERENQQQTFSVFRLVYTGETVCFFFFSMVKG